MNGKSLFSEEFIAIKGGLAVMESIERTIGTPADEKPAIVFESHLREHAHYYFAEFKDRPVDVQLLAKQARPASKFYRYRVSADEFQRSVLIKTPPVHIVENWNVYRPNGGRPQMAMKADPRTKQYLEYTALTAIQRYFEPLEDSRFDVVKPLNYLPDYSALIMEELRRPNLRQLFTKTNRLQQHFNSRDLQQAFSNAGAWLRYYQVLPKETNVQVRHSTREAFIESMMRYSSYLGKALNEESFFQMIEKRSKYLASAVLPEELPLGLGHGDFAMRNILVDDDNRITVIDTLGRWRVPIYEDIGYFLVRLKATGLQVFALGCAFSPKQLATYENQFLTGYFGSEEIPLATIRLFEIQALLDNWSAHVSTFHREMGRAEFSVIQRLRLGVINRFYRKFLCTLLDCRTLS